MTDDRRLMGQETWLTGRDLRWRQWHPNPCPLGARPARTTMVFEAVTSTPTDPSAGVVRARGDLYTLMKTGADVLTVEDEGTQTTGSPSRLVR
ncbi:hypothetical protein ACH5A2_04165 [Streptomyces collinus]|uniref:hypothetical protein n=1 Tax=Streptomyces collinus TaxID=42684 RepID=UPI00378C71D9